MVYMTFKMPLVPFCVWNYILGVLSSHVPQPTLKTPVNSLKTPIGIDALSAIHGSAETTLVYTILNLLPHMLILVHSHTTLHTYVMPLAFAKLRLRNFSLKIMMSAMNSTLYKNSLLTLPKKVIFYWRH